ncbi:hypothetical protein [Microbacterium sp. P04]|uniref:hypothetical protein n=1 Tax=Microbacterium sp. P04 TaxID=3366947 RepID=UPI003746E341
MPTAAPERRSTRGFLSGVTGVLVTAFVFATMTLSGLATAQPAAADDSTATSVKASDYDKDAANSPFPELELTVSQTRGLISQGIEVGWTGGKESTPPSSQTGGENFLQFAQCWGDDPANPGHPDRTTCQYGAFVSPGATRDGNRAPGSVTPEDEQYSTPDNGSLDPGYTAIPFKSANGETIAAVVDNKRVPGVNVNTNAYFTQYTSNEIPWAGSGADGTGSTKFEVQTVVQAQGLGCGSRVTAADGSVSGASCWLVAIPRGTSDGGEASITASGLNSDVWKHHVAVKLDFRPVGINCEIGAAERQIAGSELIATAVGSWQPSLCAAPGGDVYTIITGTESDALATANFATDTSALALTSLPYSGEGTDNLVYAPIGLTAVSVAFAIDRFPKQDGTVPDEVLDKARLPFESMKLTPRLIAKLLTTSYRDSLPNDADRTHLGHKKGDEYVPNPRNLLFDPDFLAINDAEWAQQAIAGVGISDMLIPQGRSDVATMLWRYVMADADARAFLEGNPDPWGMVVNKYSSTNGTINPTGTGLSLPRDSFPKADPTEVAARDDGQTAINLVTWRPYTNNFDSSGYLTLRGDAQALGSWDAFGNPPRFSKVTRSLPGSQAVISVTDSSAAEKYQLVTASLKTPSGSFVAPTTDSIAAAGAAMTASAAQPQVLGLDLGSPAVQAASSAYPLSMPVYAAANPSLSDADMRASYASFIRFASTTGQNPGEQIGDLPAGYAPLPSAWRDQAAVAANVLENGLPPAAAPGSAPASEPLANGTPRSTTSAAGAAPAAPVAQAAPAAGETNPTASGEVAGALAGAQTPADPDVAGLAATLPASLLAGALSAAAVLIIPRLPRRA